MATFLFLHLHPQSDVIRKPQGQIEVNATSSIARGEGKQVLQVINPHFHEFGIHTPIQIKSCVLYCM